MGHHAIEIIEDVARGNPERFDTCFGEQSVASQITSRVSAHRMRLAIDLNGQPAFQASEISDITTTRKLPTEAETARALSKPLPQDDFRQS